MVHVHSLIRYKDEAEFQACLNDSFDWFLLGNSLQKVAHDILRQCISNIRAKEMGHSKVYLFAHFFRHAAHALESWTKGILCCRRPLTRADLNHDLSKLFAECALAPPTGGKLDKIAGGLLDRLEQYILWAGRYPTPRRATDAMPDDLFLCGYDDVQPTLDLMETIKNALEQERKNKGLSGRGLFYACPNDEEVGKWEKFFATHPA